DPQPPVVVADPAPAGAPAPAVDLVPDFERAPEPAQTPEAQVGQTEGGASQDEGSKADAEVREPVAPIEEDGGRLEVKVVNVGASDVVEGPEAVTLPEGTNEGGVIEDSASEPSSTPDVTSLSDLGSDPTPASNPSSEPAPGSAPTPAPCPLSSAPVPVLDPAPTVGQASVPVATGGQFADPASVLPADSASISPSDQSPHPSAVPAPDAAASPSPSPISSQDPADALGATRAPGLDESITPTPTPAPAPVGLHDGPESAPVLAIVGLSTPTSASEGESGAEPASNSVAVLGSASGVAGNELLAQMVQTHQVEVAGEVEKPGVQVAETPPDNQTENGVGATERSGVISSEKEQAGVALVSADVEMKGDLEPMAEPAEEQVNTSGVIAPTLASESRGYDVGQFVQDTAPVPPPEPDLAPAALSNSTPARDPLVTPLPASPALAPTLGGTSTPVPEAVLPSEPTPIQLVNPPELPTSGPSTPVSVPTPSEKSQPRPDSGSTLVPALASAPAAANSVPAAEVAPVPVPNPTFEPTPALVPTPTELPASTPTTDPILAQASVPGDSAPTFTPAPTSVPVFDSDAVLGSNSGLSPAFVPASVSDIPAPVHKAPATAPIPEAPSVVVPSSPAHLAIPASSQSPDPSSVLDTTSEPASQPTQPRAPEATPVPLPPHAPSSIPTVASELELIPNLEAKSGFGAVPVLEPTSESTVDSASTHNPAPSLTQGTDSGSQPAPGPAPVSDSTTAQDPGQY
ncbi:hypothetical protein FRC06_000487, partial [Ceratobasidium sp. 370]